MPASTQESEPEPEPAPGDRMVDREMEDKPVVVVAVPGSRADEHFIKELDRTVAECTTNYSYPDDDPVVEVVYENALHRELMGRRGMEWSPEQVVEMYEDGTLAGYEMTFYSMPTSRLKPAE
jgi:hypothetical protein